MVANLPVEEWHSVHQRLRRIATRRAELDAEEARCLRDAERIQLWRRLGYVHMGEYLERELGYAPHPSAERLRVARALAELPQLEVALGEGELHYSAVRELSRVATRETEAEWLEVARGKNVRQVEAAVSGHKRGDRPDSPTSPELVNRIVRLELSPDVFALFRQAQSTLADEHGGRLDDNAFIQALCRCALESRGADDHARPAHQIAITVCQSCKRGWQNGAGREIEVSPEVIERAQCDAEHLGSLEAAQPTRVTTTVTPRVRRQVLARDHHCCTVPGCRSARNLDLHHIRYQSDGGGNELSNITAICTGHHQQLHEGALMIRGRAPDSLEFTWRAPAAPAGSAIKQAPSPNMLDTTAHPPGTSERAPAVAQAQSHRAPKNSSLVPARAEPFDSVEQAQSHGGSKTTSLVPTRAAPVDSVEQAQSHGGPKTSSLVPTRAAPVDSVEQAPLHRRSELMQRASTTAAAVDRDDGVSVLMPKPSIKIAAPIDRDIPRRQRRAPRAATTADDDMVARDVRLALITAGYKPHEARRAVEQARLHAGPEATLDQLLREALRRCVH